MLGPVRSALLGSLVATTAFAANPNEFAVFNYDKYNNGSADLPGRIYLPSDYATKSYPLVLFTHGLGEIGTDNQKQVNSNIDNLLAAAKREGFILYAPQAFAWWSEEMVDLSMLQVAKATTLYNVDTSRIYSTGLSMGGGGSWDAMIKYSDVVAAAVPIAGVAPQSSARAPLAGKPIWAFHARNDATVNVSQSRDRVNEIRAVQGKAPITFPSSGGDYYYNEDNLRYTEYATGGHGIWNKVYNEQSMYDWMLLQDNPLNRLSTPGQKILFDLGETPTSVDAQGRTWNSTAAGGYWTLAPAVGFARTTDGVRTGVHMDVTAPFGDKIDGLLTPGSLPASVETDGWQVRSYQSPAEVILRGLDPTMQYDLEFFGSVAADNKDHIARYTINGISVDLDNSNNLSNTALFSGIQPDLNGNIPIGFYTGAWGTAYTSWFSITAVPEPGTMGLVLVPALLALRRRRASC